MYDTTANSIVDDVKDDVIIVCYKLMNVEIKSWQANKQKNKKQIIFSVQWRKYSFI